MLYTEPVLYGSGITVAVLTDTPPVGFAVEPALESWPSLVVEDEDGYEPASLSGDDMGDGVTVTVMTLVSVTVTGAAQVAGVDDGGLESGAEPASLEVEDEVLLEVELEVEEDASLEPDSAPSTAEGELPPFCWAALGAEPAPPGTDGCKPTDVVDEAYGTGASFAEGFESDPGLEVMLQGFLVLE